MNVATIDRLYLSYADIKQVLVSDIVQDENTSNYVRTIQVFTDAPDTLNMKPVLEIRISGALETDVQIKTPELQF